MPGWTPCRAFAVPRACTAASVSLEPLRPALPARQGLTAALHSHILTPQSASPQNGLTHRESGAPPASFLVTLPRQGSMVPPQQGEGATGTPQAEAGAVGLSRRHSLLEPASGEASTSDDVAPDSSSSQACKRQRPSATPSCSMLVQPSASAPKSLCLALHVKWNAPSGRSRMHNLTLRRVQDVHGLEVRCGEGIRRRRCVGGPGCSVRACAGRLRPGWHSIARVWKGSCALQQHRWYTCAAGHTLE